MALFNRRKKEDEEKTKASTAANNTEQTEQSSEETATGENQMAKRQSASRPTAVQTLLNMLRNGQGVASGQGVDSSGAIDGFRALEQPIGEEAVRKANQTLRKYKEGKANLEQRIIDNEQWFKLRHWECMRDKKDDVQPVSGWLFNAIANKHADAMDNFPMPNILPREEGDKGEAQMLSSILPVILDQCEFEQVYSDVWWYKLKTGTGVYGVFWDSSKLNGLGDITIKRVDIINLFWEPGITDIQKSQNVFHVDLVDNEILIQAYPQLEGKLGSASLDIKKYVYDDTVDTTNKSVVVDWYYRKNTNGKTVLHYVKYVNNEVLFATENNEKFKDSGWYTHGQYPFVFDVLYPTEGTPAGFGYIDIGKDAQSYIDRGNQAIMKSMMANAKPRYFIRGDGAINEAEFSDLSKDLVHVDGNLGQDSILPITGKVLSNIYVDVVNNKIDELKEVTGNRDISTGGTTSGVTAASAIAAMQEAGSKLSRDNAKSAYRAFRKLCILCIELIRQFYDTSRCFRIIGENGAEQFVRYSNAGIQMQFQGNDFGQDMGYRLPQFDIEVSAQKASPYSKMSQNEMALQFYSAGFFNPQLSDQALACLDMMDFDRKQFVMSKIAQNGTMYQQMMAMQQQMIMLAQMVDQIRGSNIADQLMSQFGGGQPVAPVDGKAPNPASQVAETEALGGEAGIGESTNTKQARQRVADSTAPN